ncbi:hypothetical protein [Streptomyces sp. NPDC006309]|uniref:hypothetical protein n=1 Tax=Streptomyces sp. NPDC006309 TaxID=3156749 RepID=UPI0033AAB360
MTDSENSASVVANKKGSEGSGIVWCYGEGTRCSAHVTDKAEHPRFLFNRRSRTLPEFDAALDELSVSLNRVADDTQVTGRQNHGRDDIQIGLLRTGSGFLPVWKRDVLDTERLEELVDVNTLTDLDVMSDDELGSHLRINEDAGEWRAYTTSGGVYDCTGAGMGCFVTAVDAKAGGSGGYFATVQEESPVFDPALHELAGRLNTLVSDTESREKQKGTRDPQQRIGIAVTKDGLIPVWKIVAAHGGPSES